MRWGRPPTAADIIEAMGDGLIVTGLDGNITSVNKAMEEYLAEEGVDVKTFIGKSVFNMPLIRSEDVEKYVGLIKEVIEKGRAGPLEVRSTTGRWGSITVSLLKDAGDNPSALLAVVRDITELKRTEEERMVAAANREKAELIDVIPDALLVLDLNGVILSINSTYTKLFGYKPEERIGKSFAELRESLKPEEIERYMELLGKLIETGEAEPIETVVRSKDGRELPISVTYSLFKDDKGNPKNVIVLLRDITELKRLEEKEREKAAADRARLEELEKFAKLTTGREQRIIELKQRVKELEEKLKAK